jgi:hypothetical protein
LFQLNIETHLLVEIKDIQDELNIVSSILGEQRDVFKRLHKLCPTSTDESIEDDLPSPGKSKQKRVPVIDLFSSDEQSDLLDKRKQKGILHHNDEKQEAPVPEKKKERKVHFPDENVKNTEKETPILQNRSLVDDNLAIVMGNIRIVEDMQHYAAQVHTSVFETSLSPDLIVLTLSRSITFLISNNGRRMRGKLDFRERDRSKASGKEMSVYSSEQWEPFQLTRITLDHARFHTCYHRVRKLIQSHSPKR